MVTKKTPEQLPKKGVEAPPPAQLERTPVTQPVQQKNLESLLLAIESITTPPETVGEDSSADLGGGGGKHMQKTSDGKPKKHVTRDEAIANLPSQEAMQKQLKRHIEQEVKDLRKQAKKMILGKRPGAADKLNKLYARMRKLNGLLTELLSASYDMIKRFFVKVFIDKQPIL